MKVIHAPKHLIKGLKVYKCSICNMSFNWGKGCYWFGSYSDLENNNEVVTVCSEECKQKHSREQ